MLRNNWKSLLLTKSAVFFQVLVGLVTYLMLANMYGANAIVDRVGLLIILFTSFQLLAIAPFELSLQGFDERANNGYKVRNYLLRLVFASLFYMFILSLVIFFISWKIYDVLGVDTLIPLTAIFYSIITINKSWSLHNHKYFTQYIFTIVPHAGILLALCLLYFDFSLNMTDVEFMSLLFFTGGLISFFSILTLLLMSQRDKLSFSAATNIFYTVFRVFQDLKRSFFFRSAGNIYGVFVPLIILSVLGTYGEGIISTFFYAEKYVLTIYMLSVLPASIVLTRKLSHTMYIESLELNRGLLNKYLIFSLSLFIVALVSGSAVLTMVLEVSDIQININWNLFFIVIFLLAVWKIVVIFESKYVIPMQVKRLVKPFFIVNSLYVCCFLVSKTFIEMTLESMLYTLIILQIFSLVMYKKEMEKNFNGLV